MSGPPWRLVFMGTPDFAVPALNILLSGSDPVVGVFTQPDKPVGRGMKMTPPPVKVAASARGIPVFQPSKLRLPEAVAELRALAPDLVVVVAYGQILSREVLELPRFGCVNIHASLLPRWRGAAPIHRALLAGDSSTGITIMQMDEGLDTGPVLRMRSMDIEPTMTVGQLHDCLARLGAGLLRETLEALKAGQVIPQPQPSDGVTYARKVVDADCWIDWSLEAGLVLRQILALNPFPAAVSRLEGETVKLFAGHVGCGCRSGEPGTITALLDAGFEVACGAGALVVTEVQAAGKRRMAAADWMRGRRLTTGMTFSN